MSTLALWTMEKTVPLGGERRHLHKGALIAPAFSAPPRAPQIQFSPTALAAAMARTATLRDGPPELLTHNRMADRPYFKPRMVADAAWPSVFPRSFQRLAETEAIAGFGQRQFSPILSIRVTRPPHLNEGPLARSSTTKVDDRDWGAFPVAGETTSIAARPRAIRATCRLEGSIPATAIFPTFTSIRSR